MVVARDRARDLALLSVHPDAGAGIAPLHFIRSAKDSPGALVAVGERVVALGSVLTDDGAALTSGIVSRLTGDTIIADLNVNPGASGGPVLNLRGEVLGLNTFLLKAAVGPGLAGVVRAHLAQPLVAAAIAAGAPVPPLVLLPVAHPTPYPAVPLQSRAASIRNPAGQS